MSKKVKKFEAKTQPPDVAKMYDVCHEMQVRKISEILLEQDQLWKVTKNVCEKESVLPVQFFNYHGYTSELYGLIRNFKAKTLQKTVYLCYLKWLTFGLNKNILVKIANNLGLRITWCPSGEVADVNVTDREDREVGKTTVKNFPFSFEVSNLPNDYLKASDLDIEAVTKYLSVNVKNFPSSFQISNFPSDYPDSSAQSKLDDLLTELQKKLNTSDLSIEAITKILNVNVENFPSGFNVNNFPSGFNVNNFPATQPVSLASIPNPSNLNVALSTRALETGGNLASIKTDVDRLDVNLSTRALETGGNLAAIKSKTDNLDTALSLLYKYIRWGIPREPAWVDGAEATAPGAGTALVTKTVTAGKTGRVFGVHISADEANNFRLYSGASIIKDFQLGLEGTCHIVLPLPLLDNVAAATAITIKNVNAAAAGKIYQASLLYDEV